MLYHDHARDSSRFKMAAPVVVGHVPWIDRNELQTIYKDLYNMSLEKKEHSINRIKAWKSRKIKLPVAIEITSELQSLQILHNQANLADSDKYLCKEYSLAIVRFINHVTESGQKEEFARPIILIAKEYGIPDWLVHLRHEATHSALPALDVLIEGVKTALNWLKETFWKKQWKEIICNTECSLTTEKGKGRFNASFLLSNFLDRRIQEKMEESAHSSSKQHSNKILSTLLKAMSSPTKRKNIIAEMCKCEILYMSRSQMKKIKSEDLSEVILELPYMVLKLVEPLVKQVSKSGHGVELITEIIDCLENKKCLKTRFLVGWIYHLTFIRSEDERIHHMNIVPDFEYLSMVEHCLKKYTPYHRLLVRHFCEEIDEKNIQDEFFKLLQIYERVFEENNYVVDISSTSVQPVYTKSDLYPKELRDSWGLWECCPYDGIDWTSVPLGCLPGQVVNHKDLELVKDKNFQLLSECLSDDSDGDEMEIMDFRDVTIENIHSRSSDEHQTLESYVRDKTLAYLH